jgi:hypothetical protein
LKGERREGGVDIGKKGRDEKSEDDNGGREREKLIKKM